MIKPIIVPLIAPDIDWTLFIETIYRATGRSPTRMLDLERKAIGPTSSYLAALSYFSKSTPLALLHQCSYSFLIEVSQDEYLTILSQTDIRCVDNFTSDDEVKLIMASGSLWAWRSACLNFCIEQSSLRFRYIFNCIYIYFSGLNLFLLKKEMLSDQSFLLEE